MRSSARTDLLGVDAVQGQHAAGMENGGIQAVLDGMVEEHGVDDRPDRRQQAVGDVAHAKQGLGAGHLFLQHGQGGQGFVAGDGQPRVARAQGEGQGIEEEVIRGDPPGTGQIVEPLQHGNLALPVAGHPFLVDGQTDHGGAEVPGQGEYLFGPGAAVLEVDGVDHGPAGALPQPRLQRRHAGAVQHQRQTVLRVQPGGDPRHVAGFVTPGIAHVQVEQVRPLAGLLLGDGQHGIEVVGQKRGLEFAAAGGIGLLADDQRRWRDPEFLGGEHRGRLPAAPKLFGRHRAKAARLPGQGADMPGRRAAAAADQGRTVDATNTTSWRANVSGSRS